ncbi:phospholipase D family protein [Loktanella salsilacus]|uniref:phospholipase D family protein n=1 Tax=Loktanella salsilacus TaxID=195913 RepID=UPI003737035D
MKRMLKTLAALAASFVVFIVVARTLFPLPDIADRPVSAAIPADPQTQLGASIAGAAEEQPGLSGVMALQSGQDALASRLELAAVAEQSIDAQYYIWQDDTSGVMLLNALHQAAQRGVRVRLLLDDNGVPNMDSYMAALNAQDNFEIRLFNPSTVRSPKLLGYAFDFFRMNRRMHNKSFTVDGAAAIVGGRNIGNEYFGVGDDDFYIDMDVLAAGAVVPETVDMFDAYWNSASVIEVERIIDGQGDLAAFENRVATVLLSAEAETLLGDLQSSVDRHAKGKRPFEWTTVRLIADDPVKGQGTATLDQLMVTQLGQIIGTVENRLDLVSAYFVPGQQGTTYLSDLSDAGTEVRILTNALNTTDVLMVHAGYSKYRRELLKAGISLFELKLRGDTASEAGNQILPFGLSGASLHA